MGLLSLACVSSVLGADCPKSNAAPKVSVVVDGNTRIIRSDGCPGYDWTAAKAAYSPQLQDHTIKLPLSPRINTQTTAMSTTSGMIGIALNGIPIYAPKDLAGRDALAPAFSVHGSGQLQCGATVLTMIQGTTSSTSCARSCKLHSSCAHFTYWSTQHRCNLFAACETFVGGGEDAQTYKMDVNEGDQNDACAGHAGASGVYHYRSIIGDTEAHSHYAHPVGQINYCEAVPDSMKDSTVGQHSPLVGFALDGIPIFGPRTVGGKLPTDLDECNGHVSTQYPFYHYHMSTSYPYVIGCFRGCVCDSADYADPAKDCPNAAFVGSACAEAAVGYDYSGLIGVAAATTTSFGQADIEMTLANASSVTVTGSTESAVGYSGFDGSPAGVVRMSSLGLAVGLAPVVYARHYATQLIEKAGYAVKKDSSFSSNLVHFIEPGQSYGRVIMTHGGYKTGFAMSITIPNGRVWGEFDDITNVLKLYFAENNRYAVSKFI